MAESIVQINEGTGKKLHTISGTVGGNTVEDEVVTLGEAYMATYTVTTGVISLATALSHPLQIVSGAATIVRLRRLCVYQVAAATAAAIMDWSIQRITTAGTGGTAITPQPFKVGNTAVAAGMSLPSSKGTEGVGLWRGSGYLFQTIGASTQFTEPIVDIDFDHLLHGACPEIVADATEGIVFKNNTGHAAATAVVVAVITESAY